MMKLKKYVVTLVKGMAHYNVLFIGTKKNLDQIYDNCSLCLSENRTELLFDYDYLAELHKEELLGKEVTSKEIEFTKKDKELYKKIIVDKLYHDCYDIRDNTNSHRIKENIAEDKIDKFFENLPEDTHFFVCDGHL